MSDFYLQNARLSDVKNFQIIKKKDLKSSSALKTLLILQSQK